jgi:hypothetical protein
VVVQALVQVLAQVQVQVVPPVRVVLLAVQGLPGLPGPLVLPVPLVLRVLLAVLVPVVDRSRAQQRGGQDRAAELATAPAGAHCLWRGAPLTSTGRTHCSQLNFDRPGGAWC